MLKVLCTRLLFQTAVASSVTRVCVCGMAMREGAMRCSTVLISAMKWDAVSHSVCVCVCVCVCAGEREREKEREKERERGVLCVMYLYVFLWEKLAWGSDQGFCLDFVSFIMSIIVGS